MILWPINNTRILIWPCYWSVILDSVFPASLNRLLFLGHRLESGSVVQLDRDFSD